jgi:hypothetical protein
VDDDRVRDLALGLGPREAACEEEEAKNQRGASHHA